MRNCREPGVPAMLEGDAAVCAACCLCGELLQGGVSDRVHVEFYTNATAYEEWPSGGLVGNGTGEDTHMLLLCAAFCIHHGVIP
jgi:hypothetical protein